MLESLCFFYFLFYLFESFLLLRMESLCFYTIYSNIFFFNYCKEWSHCISYTIYSNLFSIIARNGFIVLLILFIRIFFITRSTMRDTTFSFLKDLPDRRDTKTSRNFFELSDKRQNSDRFHGASGENFPQ